MVHGLLNHEVFLALLRPALIGFIGALKHSQGILKALVRISTFLAGFCGCAPFLVLNRQIRTFDQKAFDDISRPRNVWTLNRDVQRRLAFLVLRIYVYIRLCQKVGESDLAATESRPN